MKGKEHEDTKGNEFEELLEENEKLLKEVVETEIRNGVPNLSTWLVSNLAFIDWHPRDVFVNTIIPNGNLDTSTFCNIRDNPDTEWMKSDLYMFKTFADLTPVDYDDSDRAAFDDFVNVKLRPFLQIFYDSKSGFTNVKRGHGYCRGVKDSTTQHPLDMLMEAKYLSREGDRDQQAMVKCAHFKSRNVSILLFVINVHNKCVFVYL